MAERPVFENAPGVKLKQNRDGSWSAWWAARHDIAKRGYRPKYVGLWRGNEPTVAERLAVSETAQGMQADMLAWLHGLGPVDTAFLYDGTVRSLIYCYTHDKDSSFRKLRYGSRQNYGQFLNRIERDHGDKLIADLKGRDMLRWHEDWALRGTAMAHSLIRMFRGLLTFGFTILEMQECGNLAMILSKQRFKMAPARTAFLTAEMADAIRAKAHAKGQHSIALAQAFQFEGMLRQRDVIGEWVPMSEPGPELARHRNMKWQRGLLWSEIDEDLILRHVTSKREKPIEIDLKLAPMIMEELARLGERPTFGPIIVSEKSGLPYYDDTYREQWRKLADGCGIPRDIRNQDSRAGGATEAIDAGADLEFVRQAMTHSNIATTTRYSRSPATKTSTVLKLRAAHRSKSSA
jgi:hypothetical protein